MVLLQESGAASPSRTERGGYRSRPSRAHPQPLLIPTARASRRRDALEGLAWLTRSHPLSESPEHALPSEQATALVLRPQTHPWLTPLTPAPAPSPTAAL